MHTTFFISWYYLKVPFLESRLFRLFYLYARDEIFNEVSLILERLQIHV